MFDKKKIKINNELYGGFIISKNITHNGHMPKYTYREKSSIKQLNGWTILSNIDDDQYANNPDNFEIVSATTIYQFMPMFFSIFDAPYGTDLCWLYKEDVHVGFYDLKKEKEITIDEILNQ